MRIDISARQIDTGTSCVCCGQTTLDKLAAEATRTTGKRVVKQHTRAWPFPYCQQCQQHVHRWQRANIIGLVLLPAAVVFFIVRLLGNGAAPLVTAVGGLAIAIGVFVALRRQAERTMKATCVRPGVCVHYLGWDGACQSFDVTSGAHASYLLVANRTKLVNLTPDAQRLLEVALSTSDELPKAPQPAGRATAISNR